MQAHRARAMLLGMRRTMTDFAADVRPHAGIYINALRRIAWVQPGVTWAELDAATQEHGLALTGARDPAALVAETARHSGSGWLERRLGLTSDSLRAARVMSADGVVFNASPEENADLFWALRGGGDGFGVPVELEFALRPVGPYLLGGTLRWPRAGAAGVIRAYRDLLADAPDALCGGLVLTAESTTVAFLYAGAPERGAEHLSALRALHPAADDVAVRPYRELQARLPRAEAAGHLDALTDATIDALAGDDLVLQPLGGAFGRVGELETAAGHRAARWRCSTAPPSARPERDARLLAVKQRWDLS